MVSARKDKFLPPGVWSSSQASLTIRESGATLRVFALAVPPDGCYGSYGDVLQGIPNGSFSLSGTFTQLTGFYPGKVEYPAQFSGVVEGATLSISIFVPGVAQALGPFVLTSGVTNTWGPCLYP